MRWWWRTRRSGKWVQTSYEAVLHSMKWRKREEELEELEVGEELLVDETTGFTIKKE